VISSRPSDAGGGLSRGVARSLIRWDSTRSRVTRLRRSGRARHLIPFPALPRGAGLLSGGHGRVCEPIEVDFVELARRFVATRFPDASLAIVGGSTARGTRTPTSDIDLLVLGDRIFTDGRSSLAASYDFEGELFEVFAYTPAGFEEWAERGVREFRPVIVDMLVSGTPVRDDGTIDAMRARWATAYAAGPSVSDHQMAMRRYVVTDLIDDLADATDPVETHVIAFTLYERLAELILLCNGQWIGAGKNLPRRLRELDPERAAVLASPLVAGDHSSFKERAAHELETLGGRVDTGFVR
jgi:hypothetical protein